jgi:hypothetical protein
MTSTTIETLKTISADEQASRREAWETANASVLMEGGVVDGKTLTMQEQHIKGEITLEQYFAWIKEAK